MALSLRNDQQQSQWFKFDDETEVLIARQDNAKYNIGLQRLRTYFQEKRSKFIDGLQDKAGNLRYDDAMLDVDDDEKAEIDAQSDLMARYLVLDMRTVGRDDGKVVIDDAAYQYSPDLGSQLIANSTELFVFVLDKSRRQQEESRGVADRAEKKPVTGSAGKTAGAAKKTAARKKPTAQSQNS